MVGVESTLNPRTVERSTVRSRLRGLIDLPGSAFWRVPLQVKVLLPVLLLLSAGMVLVGVREAGSADSRTRAAYLGLAERKAQLVAAQYQRRPGDPGALDTELAQLVGSSPNVTAISVYRSGPGGATLYAHAGGALPLHPPEIRRGSVLEEDGHGGWVLAESIPARQPAVVAVWMSGDLGSQTRGDLILNLLLASAVEVALLLILSRTWFRLVLDRRLRRLAVTAASIADGKTEVPVRERDVRGGDAISRVGAHLGRVATAVGDLADRRSALDSLTQEAALGLGLGHLYSRAAKLLVEGAGAESAAVYEMFAPSGMLLLRAVAGDARPRQQLALLGGQQYQSMVLRIDEALRGDDAAATKLGLPRTTRSLLAVKVPGRQAPYGMLLVASSKPEAFSPDKLAFLTSVSHMLAAAVTALHDPLTELPNRSLFEDRLAQALNEAQRVGEGVCLYYIDLDNFKEVNDSLGHHAGDELLRLVADRLKKVLRTSDLLARLGGDEFALVQTLSPARGQERGLEHMPEPVEVATQTATRLLDALARPFVVDSTQIFVGASVGVAIYPEHGSTPSVLNRNADRAMYEAKQERNGAFRIFTDSMHLAAVRRLSIESGLRAALHDDGLELHFQPQFDVSEPEKIVGFEALLRWPNSGSPAVSPGTFVPIAEESGLIVPLGLWALRQACLQAAAWQCQGLAPVRMAVNVAAAQFARADFVVSVREVLEETGLDPGMLELEVTEGSVMRNLEEVTERLQDLRELGVTIAVDDFGTGYSSLAYLNRLPFDALKVDRSFISNIQSGPGGGDTVLVNAIVQLGRNLNKLVIAEGIETSEQLRHLQRLGCDVGQGFLVGRPVSANQATGLLSGFDPSPTSSVGAPKLIVVPPSVRVPRRRSPAITRSGATARIR